MMAVGIFSYICVMKRLTLLFCALLCCVAVQAQNSAIFTQPSIEACVAATDSLLSNSKRQYVFAESYDVGINRRALDFKEKGSTAENPPLVRVITQKLVVGANPDLEIEGTTVYQIRSIVGPFLDLLPIWREQVDPTADQDQILALPSYKYPEKKFPAADGKSGVDFRFKRSGEKNWVIEFSPWYQS